MIASIRELTDLAPLHQPPALTGIEAVRPTLSGARAVACLDTAGSARTRHGCARPPLTVSASSASGSTLAATTPRPNAEIGDQTAPVATLVVTAREDLEVAREVLAGPG